MCDAARRYAVFRCSERLEAAIMLHCVEGGGRSLGGCRSERFSRSPARKGEARARAEGTSCPGDVVRRDLCRSGPVRDSALAAGAGTGTRIRFLRRQTPDPRLRRRGDPHPQQEPLHPPAVGPLAVVQRRQRRVGGEPVPKWPRQDRDPHVLRARRGPLRLRLDPRMRDVSERQHLRKPRQAAPQPPDRRQGGRLHRRAEERRLAPRIGREPRELRAGQPLRRPRRSQHGAALRPVAGLREPVRKRQGAEPGVRADRRQAPRRPALLLLRQHPRSLQVRREELARRRERTGLGHHRPLEPGLRDRRERLAALQAESAEQQRVHPGARRCRSHCEHGRRVQRPALHAAQRDRLPGRPGLREDLSVRRGRAALSRCALLSLHPARRVAHPGPGPLPAESRDWCRS